MAGDLADLRRGRALDVQDVAVALDPMAEALQRAQSALRAYFDLVGAKATIAFAADPESKKALLSALPRADERRHWRRSADDAAPAA